MSEFSFGACDISTCSVANDEADADDLILSSEETEEQNIFIEPIKDCGQENNFMEIEKEEYARRKVGFASTVSVKSIPGRLNYSEEVRTSYWSDKNEISKMTERNMIEFAAEGWDWRNATDDDQMIILNGEAVHPVHSNPYLCNALQRQIPYPRAITPPDDDRPAVRGDYDMMLCDRSVDLGAITPDAEDVERPPSPFVEAVVLDEDMQNYDEYLLVHDPDQFLRQRFSAPHHFPQQDLPIGDSEDVYFNTVLKGTSNLMI